METFAHLLPEWLETAIFAAQQGGLILKKFWGNLSHIDKKNGSGNLVTEADRQAEKAILDVLKTHFPDHQILAEESGLFENPSEFIWAVDPLDGTTNYAHQYPLFAVSIGLLYKQKPILGVIFNPITEELYTGGQGLGAQLNHFPICVSQITQLPDSLLATGFAYDRNETSDNNYVEFCHFTSLTQGVRRGGAASLDLAYVACGRLDGYWERGIKPWDIAAGTIILQEAGGQFSEYDLAPLKFNSGRILASNGFLQKKISQELILISNVIKY